MGDDSLKDGWRLLQGQSCVWCISAWETVKSIDSDVNRACEDAARADIHYQDTISTSVPPQCEYTQQPRVAPHRQ